MAIFHLTTKPISRGKGQSAIAAAAYRSGERLRDEQANEQKYYASRTERIVSAEIMTPKDAPDWARDRNALWNHAEQAETRKDARLAREIEVSLPHELTAQQREWLVKDFVREQFVRKGYAVDIAIHAPDKSSDDRNHHAHLLITERTLGPDGFAKGKDPTMNKAEQLETWREQWAHLANRHLERHGHEARIDHRNLKEQGIEREPTVHVGYAGMEIAARGGQSDRMDALKDVMARNDIRVEQKSIGRELAALGHENTMDEREPLLSTVSEFDFQHAIKTPLEVLDAATGVVETLTDFVMDFFAGGSSPQPDKQRQPRLDELRESRSIMAMISLRESMEKGERLSISDVRNLTPEHLQSIWLKGDDFVRQLVDDAREQSVRSLKGEDPEREREL